MRYKTLKINRTTLAQAIRDLKKAGLSFGDISDLTGASADSLTRWKNQTAKQSIISKPIIDKIFELHAEYVSPIQVNLNIEHKEESACNEMLSIIQNLYNLKYPRNKIARMFGVSPQAISYWVNGTHSPTPEKVTKALRTYYNFIELEKNKTILKPQKAVITDISDQQIKKLKQENEELKKELSHYKEALAKYALVLLNG
jgi:transcriptional regulator with XRE-family HTH domain